MTELEPMITPSKAATILDCAPETVLNMIERGHLRAYRLGPNKNAGGRGYAVRIPVSAITEALTPVGRKANR